MYRCRCKEVYGFLSSYFLLMPTPLVCFLLIPIPIVYNYYICSFFAALSLLFVNFFIMFFRSFIYKKNGENLIYNTMQ